MPSSAVRARRIFAAQDVTVLEIHPRVDERHGDEQEAGELQHESERIDDVLAVEEHGVVVYVAVARRERRSHHKEDECER